MALIDTGIYQPMQSFIGAGLSGFNEGMRQNGLLADRQAQQAQYDQQAKDRKRQQDLQATIAELTNKHDYQTPDGQKNIVQGLAQKGFGAEAMELSKQFPKAVQPKYNTYNGKNGAVLYNENNPKDVQPMKIGDEPVTPYEKPEKDSPTRFQLVKNKRGQMVSVDVSTGLDSKGQPVDAWQDPNANGGPRGKGGLTDAQTAAVLDRISRRTDDDPVLKVLERRENFYTTGKTAYDAYKQATPETKESAKVQADQQLLFSLAKMRDEGVVMPGEFARELQGQGWLNTALNKFTSGVTGGLNLSDDNRDYMIEIMKKFRDDAKTRGKPRYEFYKKQAEKYGDPEYATGQWSGYFEPSAGGNEPTQQAAPGTAPSSSATPEKVAKAKAYMALPPDSPYRTPAHDAAAKAILGMR